MSATEDVARHIHASLVDLRRRLDTEVAIEVARAVIEGASRALDELTEAIEDKSGPRGGTDPSKRGTTSPLKH
jgi:hypothetical protein